APAALEEDVSRLHDLVAQTVVKIVVNLLGELLVVQIAQVELGLLWHARPSARGRTPSRKNGSRGGLPHGVNLRPPHVRRRQPRCGFARHYANTRWRP